MLNTRDNSKEQGFREICRTRPTPFVPIRKTRRNRLDTGFRGIVATAREPPCSLQAVFRNMMSRWASCLKPKGNWGKSWKILLRSIVSSEDVEDHKGKASVQLSRSVVSDSLWPHESQHTRPPCPSPTPGVYSNSCPSSRWCHPAISYSVVPFSSCPQSLPASGSSPMSQLFASGGQSTGVSASTSVLPMNTQDWCPLGWTGWISLQSKGLSRVFSNTIVQKHQFFSTQLSL